jgi:hypothetical protein
MVLATHFIWTTYGTWLPGDDRGHWSPLFDLYGRMKARGHKLNVPDPESYKFATEQLVEPPKHLSEFEQSALAELLGNLIATPYAISPAFTPGSPSRIARPQLSSVPRAISAAIEPDHVHLLITALREPVSRFAGRLKGASSSALLKLAENAARSRIWTTGYWKVYLFDDDAVATVEQYIDDHNIRRGRLAKPYAWLHARLPH